MILSDMQKARIQRQVQFLIGQASMCWDPIPEGRFETSEAQTIVEGFMEELADILEVKECET